MKVIFINILLIIGFSVSAQEPLIRFNYFEDDFSPFETYHIDIFKLNGKEVDHQYSIRTKLLVEELRNRMGKVGIDLQETGDIYFHYHMQVDTLPIGFQRSEGPLPQDIIAEITIDIFDAEYNERLFTSNIYGLLVADKKNGKAIKKIYRKLFRAIDN